MLRSFLEEAVLQDFGRILDVMYTYLFGLVLIGVFIVYWKTILAFIESVLLLLQQLYELKGHKIPAKHNLLDTLETIVGESKIQETAHAVWKKLWRFVGGMILFFKAWLVVSVCFRVGWMWFRNVPPANEALLVAEFGDIAQVVENGMLSIEPELPSLLTEAQTSTLQMLLWMRALYALILFQLAGFFMTFSFGNRHVAGVGRFFMITAFLMIFVGIFLQVYQSYLSVYYS